MSEKSPRRHPGVQEASEERVLLVTRHKITGAERCDWWPSVAEAEDSNMEVLEIRENRTTEKEKKDWVGRPSMARMVLGKSGTQDLYLRDRSLDQKEFFEPVDDKRKPSR